MEAGTSPKAALMSLAAQLEAELREILRKAGAPHRPRSTWWDSVAFLRQHGVPEELLDSMIRFRDVRNSIIQGHEADDDDVLRALTWASGSSTRSGPPALGLGFRNVGSPANVPGPGGPTGGTPKGDHGLASRIGSPWLSARQPAAEGAHGPCALAAPRFQQGGKRPSSRYAGLYHWNGSRRPD